MKLGLRWGGRIRKNVFPDFHVIRSAIGYIMLSLRHVFGRCYVEKPLWEMEEPKEEPNQIFIF
jgi:hypothetical protein